MTDLSVLVEFSHSTNWAPPIAGFYRVSMPLGTEERELLVVSPTFEVEPD